MKAQDLGTTVASYKNMGGKLKESSIAVQRSHYLGLSNEPLYSVAVIHVLTIIKLSSQFTKDEKRYWQF